MEELLHKLLPGLVPGVCFRVHQFRGKKDLLKKIEERLRGFARWVPEDSRIFVIVDRDNDDCFNLKQKMEKATSTANLVSKSKAVDGRWKVVNRVVIEELEAWYFGDWQAVRRAYSRVSEGTSRNAKYRHPDAISGGTWEAFERILKKHGHCAGRLNKTEAARKIGVFMDPYRNTSPSFIAFRDAILEATA